MGKKVVLVSHNGLADGMVGSVRMIFGECSNLYSFGLAPDGSVAELGQKVRDLALEDPSEQVIVIADLLGGSVCNQCLVSLCDLTNVKVLAGMSLPLVLSVISADGELSDDDLNCALGEAISVTKVVTIPACPVDDPDEDFF